jgi:hypothetical protein
MSESQAVRQFPMQGGPSIPWYLAEKIYNEAYKPLYGSAQSLETLARRHGFSWSEVEILYRDARKEGLLCS